MLRLFLQKQFWFYNNTICCFYKRKQSYKLKLCAATCLYLFPFRLKLLWLQNNLGFNAATLFLETYHHLPAADISPLVSSSSGEFLQGDNPAVNVWSRERFQRRGGVTYTRSQQVGGNIRRVMNKLHISLDGRVIMISLDRSLFHEQQLVWTLFSGRGGQQAALVQLQLSGLYLCFDYSRGRGCGTTTRGEEAEPVTSPDV